MNDINFEFESIEKANLLYDSGRYQLALETLLSLQHPPSSVIFSTYCTIYVNCCLSLGKLKEAQDFVITNLEKYPDDSQLYYVLSLIYVNLDKPGKGLDSILKAIELDPQIPHFHTITAFLFFKMERIVKADYHVSISEKLDPEDEQNIYLRSMILIRQDKHKEAKVHIKRGLNLHPNSTLLQSTFKHLDSSNRPSASFLKEISLNALQENPFDSLAQGSLLFSLKNDNPVVRFFVSNGFNRYKIKWTPLRVILMILFWKGTIIWGGFALVYLLITWAGTALFYTVIRRHPKYQYILPKNGINMSNAFLVTLACSILGTVIMYNVNPSPDALFGIIAGCAFLILTTISYFEIDSKSGKTSFAVFMAFSVFLLFNSTELMLLFGFVSIFLLLVYAFLFTLNIAFK